MVRLKRGLESSRRRAGRSVAWSVRASQRPIHRLFPRLLSTYSPSGHHRDRAGYQRRSGTSEHAHAAGGEHPQRAQLCLERGRSTRWRFGLCSELGRNRTARSASPRTERALVMVSAGAILVTARFMLYRPVSVGLTQDRLRAVRSFSPVLTADGHSPSPR